MGESLILLIKEVEPSQFKQLVLGYIPHPLAEIWAMPEGLQH